jgi:phosphatidylserine/phosphatidylglycerophosphate/cardiolipin synthase-like enzyme
MIIPPADLRLLIDETGWDPSADTRVIKQEIFNEILEMIARADQFIYIDLFLWNPWQGRNPEEHRKLASELALELIRKKRSKKDIEVLILTDPINRIYVGHEPEYFNDMAKAGIPVVFANLDRLPDSNAFYAPFWAIIARVFGILSGWSTQPRFQNPFERGGQKISALQLGTMLLFKANHRKVVITGSTESGVEMIVGSLNPADGSSAHSNLAVRVRGRPALEALKSELACLRWSAEKQGNVIMDADSNAATKADAMERMAIEAIPQEKSCTAGSEVTWITESAIADAIIGALEKTRSDGEVRIALFYLAERQVVKAIKEVVTRGAAVRIILDANRDAFGMRKIGIPNRPVAAELVRLARDFDLLIRWADTHGEQFHTKAMSIVHRETGETVFIAGSANWTRRNIRNFNMEANLLIRQAPELSNRFNSYFDRIWKNSDGLSHTLPYEAWEEKGLKGIFKTLVYRFQERWGAATF